jgi:cellulose synthase (UDP-forming)
MTLFVLALFANINYLFFILNPVHAENLGFFILIAVADTIAIVILVSTWATALYFELSKARYYREIAELRLKGSYLLRRKVAVLVTVVNEDLSLVKNTLESAKALVGQKEIYLLDDGRKSATQSLAAQLGVRYITRENNAFFKAGNLNNAIRRHVAEDFVLVVDADFSLHPDFLQRTLPLFHDPRIAAVQTPQVYSNEDTLFAKGSKYLQSLFYTYLQPGKHLLDSAFCVGTNVIFRKKALLDVGGMAEMEHSEDIFTSIRLLEQGYKVAFLDEQLAVGLSSTALISFYNQQYRWARGGMLMLLKHNTLFNRRLHPEQRLQFFFSNFFYLSGISVIIYLISPLLAILLNVKPLNDASFGEWLPTYALFFCTNVLFFLGFIRKHRVESIMLGIFSFVPYINAFAAEFFGGRKFTWKPTNARSKGLITKLLFPYIIYLAISVAIGYFLATGVLIYNPELLLYYAWLAIDVVIVAIFVVRAYAATSKVSIPALDLSEQYGISTAEVLAGRPHTVTTIPTQPVPQPLKKIEDEVIRVVKLTMIPTQPVAQSPIKQESRLHGYSRIDDTPTISFR